MEEKRQFVFALNINKTDNSGVIEIIKDKGMKVFCLCEEEQGKEIIKAMESLTTPQPKHK